MAKSVISNRFPYGDAFIVGTPYLDQFSNQLYAEQKLREAQQQQESKALDEEFSRNLASIRTSDVGLLSNAYNDFKQTSIALSKKGKVTPEERMDLLQKKANMYKIITGSKEKMNEEKNMGNLLNKDKNGEFIDNAYEILKQGMNTPYNQPLILKNSDGTTQQIDWTDPDSLKRHVDTKAVMDAIKTAKGTPLKYSGEKYKVNPTDLNFVQPEISARNKPIDFYNSMMLSATKNPYDFANTLPQPNEVDYNNVLDKYNQFIQDPKIRSQWRIQDGQDLPDESQIKTPLEKAIKYQAMTYALSNPPSVINENIPDQYALINKRAQIANQKMYDNDALIRRRMKTAQGYREALFNYKAAKTQGQQDGILNQFNDNLYNNGTTRLEGTDVKKITIDGKDYTGRVVEVPKSIKNQYARYDGTDASGKPKWTLPDATYMTDDKKTIIPLFLKGKTSTGGYYIDKGSTPIPIQNFKLDVSKLLLTKKTAGNEVTGGGDEYDTGDESTPTQNNTKQSTGSSIMIQVGGKNFKIPKSSLSKMDKDKVKYKIIK